MYFLKKSRLRLFRLRIRKLTNALKWASVFIPVIGAGLTQLRAYKAIKDDIAHWGDWPYWLFVTLHFSIAICCFLKLMIYITTPF